MIDRWMVTYRGKMNDPYVPLTIGPCCRACVIERAADPRQDVGFRVHRDGVPRPSGDPVLAEIRRRAAEGVPDADLAHMMTLFAKTRNALALAYGQAEVASGATFAQAVNGLAVAWLAAGGELDE